METKVGTQMGKNEPPLKRPNRNSLYQKRIERRVKELKEKVACKNGENTFPLGKQSPDV
jgi:hypothetical protein